MKVNGRMGVQMEKEFVPILMVRNMKVNGRMIKDMEKEFIPILMVRNMKVNGRMVSFTNNMINREKEVPKYPRGEEVTKKGYGRV